MTMPRAHRVVALCIVVAPCLAVPPGCSDPQSAPPISKDTSTSANDTQDGSIVDIAEDIGSARSQDASTTADGSTGSLDTIGVDGGTPIDGSDALPATDAHGDTAPVSADSVVHDATPTCTPTTPPTEVCDGKDNDCDGTTDQGKTVCDDGNVCTAGTCALQGGAWSCKQTLLAGPCDDKNGCTVLEKCINGVCTPGHTTACNDQNKCTADSCDPSGPVCVHEPIPGCGLKCIVGKKQCPKPTFCVATVAGACSGAGRCEPVITNCPTGGSKVCGCDGKTWANACSALKNHVNIKASSACGP